MRTVDVVYRQEALADLQGIYEFIVGNGGSQAVASRFVERIMARCKKIGDVPLGGRQRDDLAPGLRTVPFEHTAVIAYRVSAVGEITNIFYGGRDYQVLYRNPDAE